MYLPQTDEQRMLADAAVRYLHGTPQPSLGEAARLGWIGAAFTEADGGHGGSAADIATLCEAIGRAGATLPWFAVVLLPAMLLRQASDTALRARLIGACAAGSAFAVAHQETDTAFEASSACSTVIDARGAVTGVKQRVWGAHEGSALLVSTAGADGLGIALVEAGARGLRFDAEHADASLPWARITFDGTPAKPLIEGVAPTRAALSAAADFALVGVLAESVGRMHAAFEETRNWLATRRQFGRPLADNQVLQHRLADMFIALEESRSMLNLAIHAHDRAESVQRRLALHAARVHIAHAARMIGQSAVHLHGAMGITEELGAGRAYRRIEQLGTVFGGADLHLARYVALNGGRP
ncbi:MAG: acyl-CoA dehydrogenase family protein [Burkholderiales bacterium]|nr:acyl-CoA dehydrogenase family protein [Burkholderiales bacterium]